MSLRAQGIVFATGALVATVGVVVTVIYVFQPWRTCPYDDVPAGCAMLPADAAVLFIAVLATLVGVAAVGWALVSGRYRAAR